MYPKRDSNSHILRQMLLRHSRLPFRHRGIKKEGEWPLPKVSTGYPRNMRTDRRITFVTLSCSPTWNRTTNNRLEICGYIRLTIGPLYLGPESNRHGHYCPRDFLTTMVFTTLSVCSLDYTFTILKVLRV